jgi:transcriptional regulator with XRE-family HTH domain
MTAVIASSQPMGGEGVSTTPRNKIGAWIRHYRLRRRQIHIGARWAQEDLAVAIDSDKSHVNRIECGRTIPTKRTLDRICEALGLNQTERIQLLSLAGYLAELPDPTPDEVQHIQRLVHPLMAASEYPMCLMDRDYRCWDVNALLAYCWLGFPTREAALPHVKQKRTVEQLLHPRISAWWRSTLVDFDSYARRALMCFEQAIRFHPNKPGTQAILDQLRADPFYARLLNETDGCGTQAPAFLDHQEVRVKHPTMSPFGVVIWHSTLSIDERFFLSHHVPADDASRAQFAALKSHK